MKNILFITLLSLITSLFMGCGSSGGKSSDNVEDNVILKKGETITCTKATQFSVEPTEKPIVNIVKDVENGDVTIMVNKESKGTVTVIGCTEK